MSHCNTFASILHSKFGRGPDRLKLDDVNNAVCAWMAAEIDPVDPNDFDIMEYYKGLNMTNSEKHVRVFAL